MGGSARGRRVAMWVGIVLAVVVAAGLAQIALSGGSKGDLPLSTFLYQVDRGQVRAVTFHEGRGSLDVIARSGKRYDVVYPDGFADVLVRRLEARRVYIETRRAGSSAAYYLLLFGFYTAFWIWLARRLTRLERRVAGTEA